jgi:ketosteroid isomerase-like protein
MLRLTQAVALISGFMLGTSLPGQQLRAQSADEKAIRALTMTAGSYTDDAFFFTAAYPRPLIGTEGRKNAPPPRGGERKNFRSEETIQKLQIARSGELAYAYGTARLSWDGQEPFESAFLRVFRKEQGKWKIAALFARPLDDE